MTTPDPQDERPTLDEQIARFQREMDEMRETDWIDEREKAIAFGILASLRRLKRFDDHTKALREDRRNDRRIRSRIAAPVQMSAHLENPREDE